MLSKILRDSDEVRPAPWLKNRAPAPAPVRSNPPEDASPLRAHIAELEAAVETKSRQSYEAGCRAGAEAARSQMEADVGAAVQRLADTMADLAGTRADTIRR